MGSRRRDLLWEAAIFGIALLPRLAHGLAVRAEPMFNFPLIDQAVYWGEAVRIASGLAPDPVFYWPPLFSYFLAGLTRGLGVDAAGARFILLGLSALAAPLATRLARPLIGAGPALLAGVIVAFYAPAVFYGGELLPASLTLLLNLLLLISLRAAETRPRPLWYGVSGLLLGLSALAWPAILLFLPLLLLHLRRTRRALLLVTAGTLLGILPALLHNARGGDFVPVSSNGGINFYMGNHAGADGWSARAPELPNEPGEARRAAEAIAQRARGTSAKPSAVSNYWLRRAASWMGSDPGGALALLGRKAYALLNDRDLADNIDFRATAEVSGPLRWTPLRYGLLLALALPGIAVLRRSPGGRLLLLYGIATGLAPLVFFVLGRFRLPLLPVLAVSAAAGLPAVHAALRQGWRRAAPHLLLIAAVFGFAHTGWLGIHQDTTWHYHYLRGDAYYRTERIPEATRAFEESLRRNGRSPAVMNSLGYLYAEQGIELARAESLIRSAIALAPGRQRYYLDSLGRVLYRQGRLPEAAQSLEEALSMLTPAEAAIRAETLAHLAEVRDAQGRGADAESLRAEAARLVAR